MGRAILEIVREVCDRVVVNTPATLFGTNDRIARILRTAAGDTIRDIMRRAMEKGLSGFHAQWVFATQPNVYAYRMPPDYYRMIPNTETRGNWPIGLVGPIGNAMWAEWISGRLATAIPAGWRISNNVLLIEPTPTVAEIIVISYISRFFVVRDATDDDLEPVGGYLQPISPLVPREGYIAPGGLDAAPITGTALWGEATWGTAVWGETPMDYLRRIPAEGEAMGFPAYQVRAEYFTADTDRPALDDDHLLSLGLTWRLKHGLGQAYAEEYDEYARELDTYLANDAGGSRVIQFGGSGISAEVRPLGNNQWAVS